MESFGTERIGEAVEAVLEKYRGLKGKIAVLREVNDPKGNSRFEFILPALSKAKIPEVKSIGDHYIHSTLQATMQLLFAMAYSRHPEVERVLADPGITPENFDIQPFLDQQILAGLKFLDIGCGHSPDFARCARAMGAEVYTIDKDKQLLSRNLLSDKELASHISVDANDPKVISIILNRTGGQFDLVTHGSAGWDGLLSKSVLTIAQVNMKDRGMYFNADLEKALTFADLKPAIGSMEI